MLVLGGSAQAGCSLYVLTSDPRHAHSGAAFACPATPISALGGATCANDLWPALLTDGAPVAGRGVKRQPPGDGDPHGRSLWPVGTAGDLRRPTVVLLLPGRGAGGDGRGQPVRQRGQSHGHLVPRRAEPRQSRSGYGSIAARDLRRWDHPAEDLAGRLDEQPASGSSPTSRSPSTPSARTAATRAPARISAPSTGRRSSPPGSPTRSGTPSTSTRSGRS